MEKLEVPNARPSSLLDLSLQSSCNLDGAKNSIEDSAFHEQFLIEDLDSYFEDINDRLIVSRMVSDSVIKGMVSAVSEEATERIASKEAEVAVLKKKLYSYESNAHQDFQKEVNYVVFQSLFKTLCEDFQEKSTEQSSRLFCYRNKNLIMKIGELSSLRQDLDYVSKSLFGPEPSKLLSHGSIESVEELTNEREDRIHRKALGNHLSTSTSLQHEIGIAVPENSNESQNMTSEVAELKHMTKEEIINYFKTKMTDMKRNHELNVQQMTEDYFSHKREFLKEKGSSLFRKDKDLDTLRKKIPEVILTLDNILMENEKSPVLFDDYENICSLKDRANSVLSENKRLQDMLEDKRMEVKSLSFQLSDATDKMSHHSLAEANFLKQIRKLECDIEDVNTEVSIREDIYKCILTDLVSWLRDQAKQQQILVAEKNRESDSLKNRLDDALEEIGLCKVEISKLEQKLKVAANDLREAEGERSSLHSIIQERQNRLSAAVTNELEQRRKMEFIFAHVSELSKSMADFECRVTENITQNCSRLEMLSKPCCLLVQQANLLKRTGLVYKQSFDRRCSDLQMAEAEVDLLGDEVDALRGEVDALLSHLSKIYMALDHYAPILQHYPGIMEILKLFRRELKGESTAPVNQKHPKQARIARDESKKSIASAAPSTTPRKRKLVSHSRQSNGMVVHRR